MITIIPRPIEFTPSGTTRENYFYLQHCNSTFFCGLIIFFYGAKRTTSVCINYLRSSSTKNIVFYFEMPSFNILNAPLKLKGNIVQTKTNLLNIFSNHEYISDIFAEDLQLLNKWPSMKKKLIIIESVISLPVSSALIVEFILQLMHSNNDFFKNNKRDCFYIVVLLTLRLISQLV